MRPVRDAGGLVVAAADVLHAAYIAGGFPCRELPRPDFVLPARGIALSRRHPITLWESTYHPDGWQCVFMSILPVQTQELVLLENMPGDSCSINGQIPRIAAYLIYA